MPRLSAVEITETGDVKVDGMEVGRWLAQFQQHQHTNPDRCEHQRGSSRFTEGSCVKCGVKL